jgi:hypothetical protein
MLDTCSRVLAVEGYSDLLFFAEFLEHLGRPADVFIKDMGGKGNLMANLETFLRPDLLRAKETIGVIVDADNEPEATSRSVSALLEKICKQPVLQGQWTAGRPRIGFFVVPGAGTAGEIETLVWNTWAADPANGPARQCIETYVDCMGKAGHVARSPAKGLVSALLAIRCDEDPRLGPGARARVFDFDSTEFAELRGFLSAF